MSLPAYQPAPYGFRALNRLTHLLWVQPAAAPALLTSFTQLSQQHPRHANPRQYATRWEAAADGAASALAAARTNGQLVATPWVQDVNYLCDDTLTEPWGDVPAVLLQRTHRLTVLDPNGLENQPFYMAAPASGWHVWMACPQWLAVLSVSPTVETVFHPATEASPGGMAIRLRWPTRQLPHFFPFQEAWLRDLVQAT